MRKDLGASAGLLALLGLLVHMQIPHSENSLADQQVVATPGLGSTAKPEREEAKEEPIEGPWLATEAFFGVPSSLLQQKPGDLRALIHNLTIPGAKLLRTNCAACSGYPTIGCRAMLQTSDSASLPP
jgi:hypothetical protein